MIQTYIGTLYVEECYKCGIAFGMTQDFQKRCLDSGDNFYCPNGHRQHYIKSTVQKLKDQLAREQHRLEQQQAETERQRNLKNTARYQTRAQKAAKTKLKNRIANGVCPCCRRSFQNLVQHMNHKHPDYKKDK